MKATPETAAATELGGIPTPLRRVGWRGWMVARVPVFLVVFPFLAAMALVVILVAVWILGVVAYAAGMFVGRSIELTLLVSGIDLNGSLATVFGFVGLVGVGLIWLVSSTIHVARSAGSSPYSPRERAVLWVEAKAEGLAEEWREAEDRWPARRRAIAQREAEMRRTQVLAGLPTATSAATAAPVIGPHSPGRSTSVVRRERPIVAWRFWSVGPQARHGDPLLQSLTAGGVWEGPTLEARCTPLGNLCPVGDHTRLPVPACTCGIYSSKTRLISMPGYRPGILVHGRVELSGRVLEGKRGYRAERATVVGPLNVTLTCNHHDGGCGRTATAVAFATTPNHCYQVACGTHAQHQTGQVIDDFALMIQSRLELRYGVAVGIANQGVS